MQISKLHIIYLFILVMIPTQVFSQHNQAFERKYKNIPFPTASAPGYSQQEEKYDVNFYFIDLEVTDQSTFLRGSSSLHAHRIAAEIDTFVVELSQKLTVDSVFLQGIKHEVFFHEKDLLKIVLNYDEITNEEYQVKIHYQGMAGSGGFYSGISNLTSIAWNHKITYTLSEPFQAKDWFPVKQNLRDKADSAWVFITTDSALKVGSNGLLRDVKILKDGRKRFEWKSNYPIAYYLLSFSAGHYIDYSFFVPVTEMDSVLVQNYLYDSPGILDSLKNVIDETSDLLKLFSEDFGIYPFIKEKYGHCMAPLGGGMEHQTMTTISGFDFGIIAHELAHSWFGDYLTCGTWQDIWINEGFASYAEYIALEALKSRDEAVKWLSQAHNSAINYPFGGVYLNQEESRNVPRIFNFGLSYKKGGAIIHMLRYEIDNDSVFFTILRDYVSRYANSNATGVDFEKIVEEHTGEDYTWFFDQWYYGKGYPVFITNWRQTGDSLILTSTQTSSAGDNSFFRTHMDYRINYVDGETEDFTVLYEKPSEIFRYFVPKEVQSVQSDPDSNVLKNTVFYRYSDLAKVFSASPNPFRNDLKILFRNSTKLRDIRISDISGKVILSKSTSAESLTLELSFLKPGIYFLYINEEGNKFTEKIIKR